jgi:DNA-binding NarL/FixJ family response regulator
VEVGYASSLDREPGRCAELDPAVVFVDLSDANFPAGAIAREVKGARPGARLVGFASHVDLKSLASARDAGFALTLSRSEFTALLPELLKAGN